MICRRQIHNKEIASEIARPTVLKESDSMAPKNNLTEKPSCSFSERGLLQNISENVKLQEYLDDKPEQSLSDDDEGTPIDNRPPQNIMESITFQENPDNQQEQTLSDDDESLPELFKEKAYPEESGSYTVEGKRIINFAYFLERIKSINKHEPFNCTFSDMNIVQETREGFISTFTFKCKMCNLTEQIQTEDPNVDHLNVNEAAVMGRIMTGSGYAHMNETAAILNMPCMSKGFYYKLQEKVYDNIHLVAWKQMKAAAEKEATMAIENGNVDANGIPCITVIVDGSWGKRSYNMNCTSKVGMACIIGQATREVLYMSIRNKYCCICAKEAEDEEKPAKDDGPKKAHVCYKNWNGSASAMEADIIAEGFRLSVQMYNLKYTRVVGDGDSSVMEKLRSQMPYGPETTIDKIECSNHLMRNFGKKMRTIYAKTSNVKGNVPKAIRKIVESKDQKIRTGIISAIKYRATQDNISIDQKIQLLKRDILNTPKHCIGIHTNCADYFCSKETKSQVALEQLKFFGVWDDILCAINSLAYHSKSLIYCASNNAAEQFNSIVAKFISGKRINYSGRRSYTSRCEAAAISYNVGAEKYSLLHGGDVNALGRFTANFIERQKDQREKRTKRRLLQQRRQKKIKIMENDNDNVNYGPNAATGDDTYQSDICTELIEIRKADFLNQLAKNDRQEIEQATQLQRESPRWFLERRKRLTASNFGRICKLQEKTPRGATVSQMISSSFKGNIHTEYGITREPLAVQAIEEQMSITIKKSGLLIDKEFPFLAASPDGLIEDDGMVEIKCPSSARDYTPKDAAEAIPSVKKWCKFSNDEMVINTKHEYYYQVQGQLHIAERQYCLFVFWTPLGFTWQKIYKDEEFWQRKMIEKLTDFYLHHYLIELIDSRIERQLPIRNSRK